MLNGFARMGSLLLLFGVLLALVSTGYSITCTSCTGFNCTAGNITCADSNACSTLYSATVTKDGGNLASFARACTPKDLCNITKSMSYSNVKVKMAIQCCETDGCNPEFRELPPDNETANGVVCRSCRSESSDSCYTDETIECKGNENMCLLQTIKISGIGTGSMSIRGCATKSFCDTTSQSLSVDGINTKSDFFCTSGSVDLHCSLLICVFFSLALLKILS
uniref:UPAR/Ly6 domain-containing protein n=1 Tax=Leptobrachium leishanense TaxID=445787 RepID=A0A8C5QVB5_9ANUR